MLKAIDENLPGNDERQKDLLICALLQRCLHLEPPSSKYPPSEEES